MPSSPGMNYKGFNNMSDDNNLIEKSVECAASNKIPSSISIIFIASLLLTFSFVSSCVHMAIN